MSKALFSILVLFVVLVIIDYVYSSMIRKSNYRPVESWCDLVDGKINANLIVMGSSRALVQMDPAILDSVLCTNSYNLGIDGSNINRQIQKYDIYKIRNSKPEVILQNIDVWALTSTIGYEKEQFFPFFWDSDMRKMFFKTEPFSFWEKYIPFIRYHGLDPVTMTRRHPRSLYKGYQGMERTWDGSSFRQQGSLDFSVNDTTLCMFDSFLKEAKEDSIRVVFVYAPFYYGANSLISNIDEMHQTYQGLADKYDIPILDYSDMWICHDTTYFYNAMHLNKTGAEIFTDSLANDIRRLNILSSAGLAGEDIGQNGAADAVPGAGDGAGYDGHRVGGHEEGHGKVGSQAGILHAHLD